MQILVAGMPAKADDLHRSMAISTIDPELADVMSVAKFHGLNASHFFLRDIWRPPHHVQRQAKNN